MALSGYLSGVALKRLNSSCEFLELTLYARPCNPLASYSHRQAGDDVELILVVPKRILDHTQVRLDTGDPIPESQDGAQEIYCGGPMVVCWAFGRGQGCWALRKQWWQANNSRWSLPLRLLRPVHMRQHRVQAGGPQM